MERSFVKDFSTFEDGKIIRDDDQYLVVKSVIASEIVHQYAKGYAYKPADELEKATLTFRGVPIKALSHPRGSRIENFEDVNGRVENPLFRRDLMDPKTKRPCRRGIEAELYFYRDNAPEVKHGPFKAISEATAAAIRDGTLRDNSIGFSCLMDPTPGEWQGQKYDYVQRNIFGNHLAAPIARGRCPSPYCGIAVDSLDEQDMWEETENSIRSGHGDRDSFDQDSFRTIDITEGIKAVVACPTGKFEGGKCTVDMQTQSFIFDKSKFNLTQAKAWFNKHHSVDAQDLAEFYKCPVCRRIDEIGMLTVGQRLYKQYGADVLEVIEGHEIPHAEPVTPVTSVTPAADGKQEEKPDDKQSVEATSKDQATSDTKPDDWADQADKVIQENREALKRLLSIVDHLP